MANAPPRQLWKRLVWLGTIWILSVLTVGLVAQAIRFWLVP